MLTRFAHAHMRWIAALFVAIFLLASVGITMAINGAALETRFFPVNSDHVLVSVKRVGNDIEVTGTLYVARQCEYVGIQAKEAKGKPLNAYSRSPFQRQQWVVGQTYAFGPWVIQNGAGREIFLTQHHECHEWWQTVSRVATIDARNL